MNYKTQALVQIYFAKNQDFINLLDWEVSFPITESNTMVCLSLKPSVRVQQDAPHVHANFLPKTSPANVILATSIGQPTVLRIRTNRIPNSRNCDTIQSSQALGVKTEL